WQWPALSTLFPYTTLFRSPSCSGEFSQEIRDRLYLMSDHLPVTLELETNRALHTQTIATTLPAPRIIPNPVANNLIIYLPESSRDRKSTRLNSSHVSISYA